MPNSIGRFWATSVALRCLLCGRELTILVGPQRKVMSALTFSFGYLGGEGTISVSEAQEGYYTFRQLGSKPHSGKRRSAPDDFPSYLNFSEQRNQQSLA